MKAGQEKSAEIKQRREYDYLEKNVSDQARVRFKAPAYEKIICNNCGKELKGKCECVETQRNGKFYFCKDMGCFKEKGEGKKWL